VIYDSILGCVGKTPLLALMRLSPEEGARLYAKLEPLNPGGSTKDRVALAMIRAAERDGRLKPGGTVVEPTSGNTGIGLAMAAAALGYRAVVVTPASSRAIRRDTLRHLGARVVATDPNEGMGGAVMGAKRIAAEIPGAVMLQQFQNPANPEIHQTTTGPEIIEALGGAPEAFVAGLGTGGTLTGVGRALKEKRPDCRVIAVEPAISAPSGGGPLRHCLEGIGVGFRPEVLDARVIDETQRVSESEALRAQEELARREGVLVGPSSGAALFAALAVARRLPPEARVVVMLADTGERYFRAQGSGF
jgi:cysteine synthase